MRRFCVTCAGLQYIAMATSASAAILSAIDLRRAGRQRPEAGMSARQTDNMAARGNTDAAWLVGWWQGKVVGIVLGMALAVLIGQAK